MPTTTVTSPDGTVTTTVTDAQGRVLSITQTFVQPPDAVNTATIQAALDTRLAQIEAYIAANPNGSVLTAAQTLIVAKMLAGLVRLARNSVTTTGQAS